MANMDNEIPPGAREDTGARRKNIGLFIAVGAFFIVLFIILAYWAFAPTNTPMGNTRLQQTEQR